MDIPLKEWKRYLSDKKTIKVRKSGREVPHENLRNDGFGHCQ
jgi:hypothetical protein